ncbi:MAG: hypothetical protein VXZ38_00350 [Planctomycetota bacterium]|nr:hypothetical protein [Planctomycetota bacterium]
MLIPIGSTGGESLDRDALLQTGYPSFDRVESDPPWLPHCVNDLNVFGNAILPASAEIFVTSEEPEPPSFPLTSQANSMCEVGAEELELERFKRQALQSLSLEFGGVSRLDSQGLRNGYLEMGIGSGLPLGSLDRLLGVTPRVRIDWLGLQDSSILPQGYGIASDLYQFELQFFYRQEITKRLSGMAIISPAIRSDLSTDYRALRWFVLALMNWEWIPDRVTLSGGFVMLGRADLPILPALGLLWTPNRRTQLDFRFPMAKAAYRLTKDGGRSETWAYVTGGLGGTTWAVTRLSEATSSQGSPSTLEQTDEFSLRDYRLLLGWERQISGGGGCFVEGGFAFARRLRWETPRVEVEIPSAGLIQAGWRY